MIGLLFAVGCSEHGQGGQLFDADPATCAAEFQASLERACQKPNDCVLVDHDDCCGIVKLGIRIGTEPDFPAHEAAFHACHICPPSGCAHADVAEDGMSANSVGQAIVATCVTNRCTSIVQ
jgi:hypothetical protein